MIRKFKDKDIDRVMQIWLETTIKAHDFISREYWESNYNTVKEVYMPMGETYVYEENNEVKGFVSVINNEFIGAIFVDEKAQGNGIGKQLIDYLANKYNKLNLAVYKDNKNTVEFYLNRGFKIVQEQVNEDSGHVEYIMEK